MRISPRTAVLAAGLLASVVVAVDQLTKAWAVRLWSAQPETVFGLNWWQLDVTYNRGASFSLNLGDHFPYVLLGGATVLALFIWLFRSPASRWTVLGVGLMAGGILGNLVDRLRVGAVIDFIEIGWFPVFNLADSSLFCGVVLLVSGYLRQELSKPRASH